MYNDNGDFMKKIIDVAQKINIDINSLELYGNYKAKLNVKKTNKMGKLILVTAMHPTPYGEGKTTISIGINDAMAKLNLSSIAVLREPSLGPVFGIKGGATGGGLAKAIPSDDIDLHFTGDFHAITSANNLLCSLIDNHIYHGNKLNINPNTIAINRCIDLNDRTLRKIKLENRYESFTITAASEMMAIFCLAEDIDDLRNRINQMIIGYNFNGEAVYVKELNCTDSLILLLRDAIKPNLVQSLEENPIIIHGGPFANIAHGCNSIIATKTALSLSDYVITEAGFGSDLGAEKFMDIKCRHDLRPDAIALVITLKAIKHQAGIDEANILNKNIEAIQLGLENVKAHINNLKEFSNHILVVLNQFENDDIEEIEYLKKVFKKENILFECSKAYTNGGDGSKEVALKLVDLCNMENDFKFLYSLDDSIINKIEKIARTIYHANKINFDNVFDKIEQLEKNGFNKLPICMAKTPFSFSDSKNLLGNPTNYEISIKDIKLCNGAGFIIVYLNNIITLPGLPEIPNACKITL